MTYCKSLALGNNLADDLADVASRLHLLVRLDDVAPVVHLRFPGQLKDSARAEKDKKTRLVDRKVETLLPSALRNELVKRLCRELLQQIRLVLERPGPQRRSYRADLSNVASSEGRGRTLDANSLEQEIGRAHV